MELFRRTDKAISKFVNKLTSLIDDEDVVKVTPKKKKKSKKKKKNKSKPSKSLTISDFDRYVLGRKD